MDAAAVARVVDAESHLAPVNSALAVSFRGIEQRLRDLVDKGHDPRGFICAATISLAGVTRLASCAS